MDYIMHGEDTIEITSNIIIHDSRDFLNVMGSHPSKIYLFRKSNFDEGFFDLSTGIAGDILQKASNYKIKIGIIGDFRNVQKKSLKDFIYESNRTRQVVFANTI